VHGTLCKCADQGPASIGAGSRDMRPVVICGFGELGQSVVNMLESPLSQTLERGQVPYVAFDLQPARIKAARAAGFNVLYGSASTVHNLCQAAMHTSHCTQPTHTTRTGSTCLPSCKAAFCFLGV